MKKNDFEKITKNMSHSEKLLYVFSLSLSAGGGIQTAHELAFMMKEDFSPSFTKFLSGCVKKGIIRRISNGIYESVITPTKPTDSIYLAARKIRASSFKYISLESQLSYTGVISQVAMGTLTLMTNGRSGIFDTPYGFIEFIHTKKNLDEISKNLYNDKEVRMYRANNEQAIADLKDVGRNLQMIEDYL